MTPPQEERPEKQGAPAPASKGTEDLDALRQALDQCSSEREQEAQNFERIITAIGHDLRTPIRTITTNAQLLQRQLAADPGTAELSGYLVQAAGEMNAIIEDLLRYWRAGKSLRMLHVNLAAVVQWAVMNLQPRIREANAVVTFGRDLPELSVDESQMSQVFQQLIENSIRFRRADAPRVSIEIAEDESHWRVTVRDNGTGIDPKYLNDAFLPFKRLHPKGVSGSGLGLAMCRKIVNAHGGSIWAESDGQTGTSIHFTLPA